MTSETVPQNGDNTAPKTHLALRRVAIDTCRENVAYLHRDCAVYRAEGFQALSKIEVSANGRRILATLNVVDDERIVGCHELGLSEVAFLQLAIQDGHTAAVSQAEPPDSIGALRRKIAGARLDRADFKAIIQDIADLRYSKSQKSLRLAGRLIECHPDVRGGDGFAIARDILDSGRALTKMRDIMAAQGQKTFNHNDPPLGALTFDVCATHAGMVTGIDNLQIARIARLAGARKVVSAGVDLFRKLGDAVAAGDLLYRVHAGFQSDQLFAKQASDKANGYLVGSADQVPQVFVKF